jgi:hypothetical protein
VTTWDGAYHWHTDKPISAVDAIKLRENGRKESGDYWCHKSCYSRQPRDGIELYPRNHPITPHFWKGSGNFTKINDCEFYQLQIERKESTRYSQFYHDLRSWLDTDEAKQNLGFSTYSENKARKYSDFILVATTSKDVTWTEMEIIVVHKNRKRVPQTNNYIRIDLSQWKIEHILNFEGYGKRMIIEEFNQLITKNALSNISDISNIKVHPVEDTNELGISNEEYEKLIAINNFLDGVQYKIRKPFLTKFTDVSEILFGQKTHWKDHRERYITKEMEKINFSQLLKEQIHNIDAVFARNKTLVAGNIAKWSSDLNNLRSTNQKSENFNEILENFDSKKQLSKTINEMHINLFDTNNEFFRGIKCDKHSQVFSRNIRNSYDESKYSGFSCHDYSLGKRSFVECKFKWYTESEDYFFKVLFSEWI